MNLADKYFQLDSRDILNFIVIRKATGVDDDDIGDLLVKSFQFYCPKKLSSALLENLRNVESRRSQGEILVAEFGYRAVGTCTVIRPESLWATNWITDAMTLKYLAIDPEFRGLHLSHRLLQEAEKRAVLQGASGLCVQLPDSARSLATLFVARGYKRDSRGNNDTEELKGFFRQL